jgi:hypothetical protein
MKHQWCGRTKAPRTNIEEKPISWRRHCSDAGKKRPPFKASGRKWLANLWQMSTYLPAIRTKTAT